TQPDASPAHIIASCGTADTKPLAWRENPCACTKYVGSHENMNQAVQLVMNVVARSARTAGSRRKTPHGTSVTRAGSRATGGASGAQRTQSATHTRPTTPQTKKTGRQPCRAAIQAESGSAHSA